MISREPEAPDRTRELMAMWRTARESFGLSAEHSVCRNIQRLAKVWNEPLYCCTRRALANLETARETASRMADRIPPPEAFQSGLEIAFAPTPGGTDTSVRIPEDQLTLHGMIAGLPGSGKTWFVRRLLACLIRACPHVRILVFDPNDSFASFCADPRMWLTILWLYLRLNPIVPPPGFPLELWLSGALDLLGRGYLMHSLHLVQRRLDALVAEARRVAASEETIEFPSLFDLRDNLVHRKCRPGSKEDQYRESAVNLLDGRLRSTASVYDCARGMEPLLTSTRARISTKGLSPVASLEFLINNLIHYVYRARSTGPLIEPPRLHTLIVIEEAQTLLERRAGGGITFYQEILLRARSLGIGFLFVTQSIDLIDPLVLAAVSNHFIFGQSSAQAKRVVRETLDLSRRETEMLGELQTGEVFVKFAGHPTWPHPFLARVRP